MRLRYGTMKLPSPVAERGFPRNIRSKWTILVNYTVEIKSALLLYYDLWTVLYFLTIPPIKIWGDTMHFSLISVTTCLYVKLSIL